MRAATTYVVPRRVAHVVTEESGTLRVALMGLPDGLPVVLTEAAALIWLVAADGSSTVVEDVAQGAGQAVEAVRSDVEAFVDDLVSRGLLAPVDVVGAASASGGR